MQEVALGNGPAVSIEKRGERTVVRTFERSNVRTFELSNVRRYARALIRESRSSCPNARSVSPSVPVQSTASAYGYR